MYRILAFLLFVNTLVANEKPLSILIIGGGPAGLAKIEVPGVTVISAQGNELSLEKLSNAALEKGWKEEADQISAGIGTFSQNFEVILLQAKSFVDSKKSALLIGDAAATASFIQGMGANTALESAEAIGLFFHTDLTENDFSLFNQKMQEITNRLLSDSLFLFNHH
jgi:2-polyprenyl-6-methoxyphenol hydroxylase-like FAD-dependent oxidoreductase